MKQFTTIKVGYTAGVYGCSGEYFTTIFVDNNGIHSVHFYGMYGAEERVARFLKELGYEEKYVHSSYGRMVRNDIPKHLFETEYSVIKTLEEMIGVATYINKSVAY